MLHRNLYISKILPIKTRNEKKNTLLMLYLKLLDIQHFQPYVPEMFCIQIMVSFLWRRLSMVYHASKPLLSRLSSSKKINIHCIVMSFKEIFKHDKCTYLMSRKFFSRQNYNLKAFFCHLHFNFQRKLSSLFLGIIKLVFQ